MSIDRRIFLKRCCLLALSDLLTGCGSSTSQGDETPSIEDVKLPPSIKVQPSDQVVFTGESADFNVVVEGSGPFIYQWKKDAINMPGANSATYTTELLALADTATSYSVEVSNSNGVVISRDALLTVTQLKITTDQTSITIDSSQITIDRV